MQYQKKYRSPLGEMLLAANDRGLVGIWFRGAEHFGRGLEPGSREGEHPFLLEAERWLDCYFSGREPEFQPPVHWQGTPFQQTVWELLRQIPYGSTVTYGTLAVYAAERLGRPGMLTRRWAEPWPAIHSLFWCRATGWWGRTAA